MKKHIFTSFLALSFCIFAACSNASDVTPSSSDNNTDNKQNSSDSTKKDNTDNKNDNKNIEKKDFYISEITDSIFAKMKGKSYKDDCTIKKEDLRYIHVLHKTLDKKDKEGEIVVNYHIADDVLNIFKELYKQNYPIEKISLIDNYDADDEKSMEANNSSSFNFRKISYSENLSPHAYGLAIDINPLYNPYIKTVNGKLHVEPSNATSYTNRDKNFNYKMTSDDICVKTFKKYNFEWGGDWSDIKDYQHFQISDSQIKKWYNKLN